LHFKYPSDKRSYYRAANSIFADVGRLASDELMMQLLQHKCLSFLLLYCDLDKKNTAVDQLYVVLIERDASC